MKESCDYATKVIVDVYARRHAKYFFGFKGKVYKYSIYLPDNILGKDMQCSTALCFGGLQCLSAAVKCFPTSIVRDAKSGLWR